MDHSDYRCACGGTQAIEVWRGHLYKSGLKREFSGRACSNCGLTSLWPPVTEEEVSAALEARGWKGVHCPQSSRGASLRPVREGAARLFRRLVAAEMPPPASVMDIGCGTGGMARKLAERGYQVSGIEPDSEIAAQAAAHGIEVYTTTLGQWPVPDRKYDAVIMSNVLEHVSEPLESLKKIARILAPGGRLFIEVPNIERPKTSYRRAFQLVHRWYFSPASLRYLLGLAGLRPVVERVFRFDCFQTVAGHAPAGQVAPADPAAAARIRARLRRHRWLYYARLQFIWRKLPGLRDLIFFAAPQVTRYPESPA